MRNLAVLQKSQFVLEQRTLIMSLKEGIRQKTNQKQVLIVVMTLAQEMDLCETSSQILFQDVLGSVFDGPLTKGDRMDLEVGPLSQSQ